MQNKLTLNFWASDSIYEISGFTPRADQPKEFRMSIDNYVELTYSWLKLTKEIHHVAEYKYSLGLWVIALDYNGLKKGWVFSDVEIFIEEVGV